MVMMRVQRRQRARAACVTICVEVRQAVAAAVAAAVHVLDLLGGLIAYDSGQWKRLCVLVTVWIWLKFNLVTS